MASRLVEWSIIACFPAGIFLMMGLLEVPSFFDPCHSWSESSQADAQEPEPASHCLMHTSTNETRSQAATRLMLFQGTSLSGLIVALAGAARRSRLLLGVGAGLLALISIPLMPGLAFLFPLASALLLLLGLALFWPRPEKALEGA